MALAAFYQHVHQQVRVVQTFDDGAQREDDVGAVRLEFFVFRELFRRQVLEGKQADVFGVFVQKPAKTGCFVDYVISFDDCDINSLIISIGV